MSLLNAPSRMIFGGATGPDGSQSVQANAAAQTVGEPISATTARMFTGPQKGTGRLSVHWIITGTITGSVSVAYSNLPEPVATTAGHWVTDSSAAATVALSGSAINIFQDVGNVIANYVLITVTVSSGSGSVVAWVRYDGDQGP